MGRAALTQNPPINNASCAENLRVIAPLLSSRTTPLSMAALLPVPSLPDALNWLD